MSSDGSGRNSKLEDLARKVLRQQQDTGIAVTEGNLKHANYGHKRAAKLEQRLRKLEKRGRYNG